MRSAAWRRASIQTAALLFLGLGCVLAGGGGCKHDDTDDMTMAPDKLKAITSADAIISAGEREIKDGEDLKDKDADQSAKLIQQGQADKTRGEALRDQAYMMK
jgi:hypothetical protein